MHSVPNQADCQTSIGNNLIHYYIINSEISHFLSESWADHQLLKVKQLIYTTGKTQSNNNRFLVFSWMSCCSCSFLFCLIVNI